MTKFKTRKKVHNFLYVFLLIIIINVFLFNYYDKNIYSIALDYATSKLEYISTMYIKRDIIPKSIDLDELLIVSKNNKGYILSIDTNYDYAYKMSSQISSNIQNNILNMKYENFIKNDKSISFHDENIYLLLPLLTANRSTLLGSLGPKVPIKLDFYEYVLATVDTVAKEYGINNVLIEVTLTISFEQKILFPYKENKYTRDYSLKIGSKLISGEIPEAYGGIISTKSAVIS